MFLLSYPLQQQLFYCLVIFSCAFHFNDSLYLCASISFFVSNFLLIFFFLFVLRLCSEPNRDHAFLLLIYSLIYVALDLVVPSKIATVYGVPSISCYN